MASRETGKDIKTDEITPVAELGNQSSVKEYRSRAVWMEAARHSSAELEGKWEVHPRPHYPEGLEAVLRRIPGRASLPKVTQSYKITEKILENVRSLKGMFQDSQHPTASTLSQEDLQKIAFLVSLANDQCGKGYRKSNDVKNDDELGKKPVKETDDKPDKRPKKEIKRELAIYREIGNNLDQWEKFLEANGNGIMPADEPEGMPHSTRASSTVPV